MKKIGEKVRQLRQMHGITQKQLGEQLKYSESFISYVESGDRSFDPKDLPKLAEIFSVPASYFLDHHFANFRADSNHSGHNLDEVMNNFKKFAKHHIEKNHGRT